MKTRAALVLSVAGILVTGAAALAANTYTLNSTHTSTLGNAGSVLLPDVSHTATPAPVLTPSDPVASPQTPPAAASQPPPSQAAPGSDDGGTVATGPVVGSGGTVETQPGAGTGGTVVTQPGADSGGTVVTQPGDDKGGLRGGSGGHGSDD
jgi:hypothetical protein